VLRFDDVTNPTATNVYSDPTGVTVVGNISGHLLVATELNTRADETVEALPGWLDGSGFHPANQHVILPLDYGTWTPTSALISHFPDDGGQEFIELSYDECNAPSLAPVVINVEDIEMLSSLAIDQSGNLYATGGIYGSNDSDAVLVKYDVSANHQWTRYISTPKFDYGRHVTLDRMGNPYLSGQSTGTLSTMPNDGGYSAFAQKYDSAGFLQWTNQWQGSSAVASAVDSDFNVYTLTRYYATPGDAVVRKTGPDGAGVWNTVISSQPSSEFREDPVAVGPSSSVLVAWSEYANAQWQTFVRSYDSLGQSSLDVTHTDGGTLVAASVAADHEGNLLVALSDFSSARSTLRKYSESGDELWAFEDPSDAGFGFGRVVVDEHNNIYASAHRRGASFSSGTDVKVVVFKFSPDGGVVWTREWESDEYDYPLALAAGGGAVYIGGYSVTGSGPGSTVHSYIVRLAP
jgi:hypothetical protein